MKHRSRTATPASPPGPDPDNLPLLHSRTLKQAPAHWPNGENPQVRAAVDELDRQKKGGR